MTVVTPPPLSLPRPCACEPRPAPRVDVCAAHASRVIQVLPGLGRRPPERGGPGRRRLADGVVMGLGPGRPAGPPGSVAAVQTCHALVKLCSARQAVPTRISPNLRDTVRFLPRLSPTTLFVLHVRPACPPSLQGPHPARRFGQGKLVGRGAAGARGGQRQCGSRSCRPTSSRRPTRPSPPASLDGNLPYGCEK